MIAFDLRVDIGAAAMKLSLNWLLIFIREVCLVVWLGGLIVVDFIETPIRFRTPEISKEQATAIGSRLFARFGWIQVLVGTVLLFDCVSISIWAGHGRDWVPVILAGTMLFAALIQSAYVTPRMLKYMGLFDARSTGSEGQHHQFRALHKFYVSADVSKLIVGFSLLLYLSRPGVSAPGY